MNGSLHPVSEYIDIDHADYERKIVPLVKANGPEKITVKIWNPVQFENGGYVSAVSVEGLPIPLLSAMPGEDKLDALLNAVAFVSETLNRHGVVCEWQGKPLGGFPPF